VRRAAALLAAACAVFALGTGACRRSGPDWRILQLYSGERTADLLAHPASVRAFPLDPVRREGAAGDVHAGPFAAAGAARDVHADAAAELSAVLSDAASYDWQRGPKRTPFRPRIGFWFVRGAYVLEVAVDLETAQLGVYAGGQTLGLQSVDPAVAKLASVAERALGRDALPPR
jgi:hypothetical protein